MLFGAAYKMIMVGRISYDFISLGRRKGIRLALKDGGFLRDSLTSTPI
jgi:hypothetical protein